MGYRCVYVLRDKNGVPKEYTIEDTDSKRIFKVKKDRLKEILAKQSGIVDNLKLTSNNRIIESRHSNKNTKIVLYHGSQNKVVVPQYDKGEDKRDYGRGFYLTPDKELAKEWACCSTSGNNGWIHTYVLDTASLTMFSMETVDSITWVVEIMKHRPAASSTRYKQIAPLLIKKYGIDTSGYDIIKGWRADSSYFSIAKSFIMDNLNIDLLDEALKYGDLGIQYCIKSEKAFRMIHEDLTKLEPVSYTEYNGYYNERDSKARDMLRDLLSSDRNVLTTGRVCSNLII